jgi:hypothetical protein
VVLREALTKGMESGDVVTTLDALGALLARYDVKDGNSLRHIVLQALDRSFGQHAESQPVDAVSTQQLARAWHDLAQDCPPTDPARKNALERARFWEEQAER